MGIIQHSDEGDYRVNVVLSDDKSKYTRHENFNLTLKVFHMKDREEYN